MDIAKAFEILSQGKIVSTNSNENTELVNFLFSDSNYGEFRDVLDTIGYRLIGEDGYYYIAQKRKLTIVEQQTFINKNRETIIAVAFLRQLYPRLDKSNIISFINTVAEYINVKKENEGIREKLTYFSWAKNKEDERQMLEQLFKFLEEKNILEKENSEISDKYKVLNAISYYISIAESVEKGDDDA